jgi:hypothetical protein
MIHAYLSYNTVVIQKQLTDNALLVKEMSEKSTFLIDFIHCINEILSSGILDVDHISKEVVNNKVKISLLQAMEAHRVARG